MGGWCVDGMAVGARRSRFGGSALVGGLWLAVMGSTASGSERMNGVGEIGEGSVCVREWW